MNQAWLFLAHHSIFDQTSEKSDIFEELKRVKCRLSSVTFSCVLVFVKDCDEAVAVFFSNSANYSKWRKDPWKPHKLLGNFKGIFKRDQLSAFYLNFEDLSIEFLLKWVKIIKKSKKRQKIDKNPAKFLKFSTIFASFFFDFLIILTYLK